MPTKIITNKDVFFNRFTRTGRKRNSVYNRFKQDGYNEIRQRVSGDSVVITGYKDGEKMSDHFYMIKTDGTMAEKHYERGNSISTIRGKFVDIVKRIIDSEGNETAINTELTYHKDNFILEKIKTIFENEKIKESYQSCIEGVVEPNIAKDAGSLKDVITLEEIRKGNRVEVVKTKMNGSVIKESFPLR